MKKVYVIMAEGFEVMELLTPVDVCSRCKIDIKMVSLNDTATVTSSHGVEVKADQKWADTDFDYGDAIVLPGGYPGYMNLAKTSKVGDVLRKYFDTGKFVAIICGAPYVLAVNGLAKDRRMTCHHTVVDKMVGYNLDRKRVVVDGNLITGRGAGCALDFSLALVSALTDGDEETIANLKHGLEIED